MTRRDWMDLSQTIKYRGTESSRTELFGAEVITYTWSHYKASYQGDTCTGIMDVNDSTEPHWIELKDCAEGLDIHGLGYGTLTDLISQLSHEKERRDNFKKEALKQDFMKAFNALRAYPDIKIQMLRGNSESLVASAGETTFNVTIA